MVDALKVAMAFHEAYERLAPSFGYETRKDTKTFDPESQNGKLMISVCQAVGDQIENASFNAGFRAGCKEANIIYPHPQRP